MRAWARPGCSRDRESKRGARRVQDASAHRSAGDCLMELEGLGGRGVMPVCDAATQAIRGCWFGC